MIQRLIKLGDKKKVIFHFNFMRHGNQYSGRFIKYRGQQLIIVWRTADLKDCDFLILHGKRKVWQEALIDSQVDKCCCDECCTGCAQCIGGTLCCFACVDKKPGEKSKCPCAKKSCVKKMADQFYKQESQFDLQQRALEEQRTAITRERKAALRKKLEAESKNDVE